MFIYLKVVIIAASFATANNLRENYENNYGLADYDHDSYIPLTSNHDKPLNNNFGIKITGDPQESMENEIYDEDDDYNIFDQNSSLNDDVNITDDEIGENFENQIFQDSAASSNTEVEIIDPSKLINGNLSADSLKKIIEQLKSGGSPSGQAVSSESHSEKNLSAILSGQAPKAADASSQRSQIAPSIFNSLNPLDSTVSTPPSQPKANDGQDEDANSESKNPLESINMAAISSATRTMRMIPAWGEFNMPIPAPEYLRSTCDALTIKQVNSPLRLISKASKTGNGFFMRQGLIESIKIIQSGENSISCIPTCKDLV
ncbi:hypothetical protein AYI69_g6840 [Smittium culicis]|uniref:Uncharacterized protein n=1 Tax=Smittium culicis TaxID=133412 RepID=A0A1R1XW67_9FUNG|nr:hypothetical protein AYI69_g6840 [Smittium culicis]